LPANKAILLNKLKQLYQTYEVNNNAGLTDHAKVINNQFLSLLNETKLQELQG